MTAQPYLYAVTVQPHLYAVTAQPYLYVVTAQPRRGPLVQTGQHCGHGWLQRLWALLSYCRQGLAHHLCCWAWEGRKCQTSVSHTITQITSNQWFVSSSVWTSCYLHRVTWDRASSENVCRYMYILKRNVSFLLPLYHIQEPYFSELFLTHLYNLYCNVLIFCYKNEKKKNLVWLEGTAGPLREQIHSVDCHDVGAHISLTSLLGAPSKTKSLLELNEHRSTYSITIIITLIQHFTL